MPDVVGLAGSFEKCSSEWLAEMGADLIVTNNNCASRDVITAILRGREMLGLLDKAIANHPITLARAKV